jgi:hypothetical protein
MTAWCLSLTIAWILMCTTLLLKSSLHPWITSRELGTRGATVPESNKDTKREAVDLGIVDSCLTPGG